MTIESLTLQLRVAGLLLIGLAFAHAFMPRQFKWAVELARLAPVNKSIFISHTLFIAMFLLLTGLLSLCFPAALLEHSLLARLTLTGLIFFWLAKLITQWPMFPPKIWRQSAIPLFIPILASALWIYFVAVYFLSLLRQLLD